MAPSKEGSIFFTWKLMWKYILILFISVSSENKKKGMKRGDVNELVMIKN